MDTMDDLSPEALDRLQDTFNKARLALSGYVRPQVAIDALDSAADTITTLCARLVEAEQLLVEVERLRDAASVARLALSGHILPKHAIDKLDNALREGAHE
jgi:hypothetical protein